MLVDRIYQLFATDGSGGSHDSRPDDQDAIDCEPLEIFQDQADDQADDDVDVDRADDLHEENSMHYYCRNCDETFIASDHDYCIRCGGPVE